MDTQTPTSFHQDLVVLMHTLRWPLVLLSIMWGLHAFDQLLNLDLYRFGIFPRSFRELTGIVTGPFIHGSWGHLASNTMPWLVLTSILLTSYPRVALQVSLLLWACTGFLVWMFARPSYHIGISGVIYGYISFIFWTGVFRGFRRAIVLSLVVLILYAGSVESIFPNVEKGVSWESHLAGAVSGIVLAFVFKNVLEGEEQEEMHPVVRSHDDTPRYFLPRDVFEKTMLERYYEQLEEEIRQSGDAGRPV